MNYAAAAAAAAVAVDVVVVVVAAVGTSAGAILDDVGCWCGFSCG